MKVASVSIYFGTLGSLSSASAGRCRPSCVNSCGRSATGARQSMAELNLEGQRVTDVPSTRTQPSESRTTRDAPATRFKQAIDLARTKQRSKKADPLNTNLL